MLDGELGVPKGLQRHEVAGQRAIHKAIAPSGAPSLNSVPTYDEKRAESGNTEYSSSRVDDNPSHGETQLVNKQSFGASVAGLSPTPVKNAPAYGMRAEAAPIGNEATPASTSQPLTRGYANNNERDRATANRGGDMEGEPSVAPSGLDYEMNTGVTGQRLADNANLPLAKL